jgi:hypothetical protein
MDSWWTLTKKQYDYLLPVLRDKMLRRIDRKIEKYSFIGTQEEYLDAINRCAYLNN